jgi:hypothetical protein
MVQQYAAIRPTGPAPNGHEWAGRYRSFMMLIGLSPFPATISEMIDQSK